MEETTVLEVKDLAISFQTFEGVVKAVRGVEFMLKKGETLAIVGESGSGKSVSTKAINRLLPEKNTLIERGEVLFEGQDLLKLSEKDMQGIRGNDIAMIFQDPMTSLNPTMTVGKQIAEPIIAHKNVSKEEAKEKALELMDLVGIHHPKKSYKNYPHQFSGGMRQRVMIAIALACEPKILIADEPTTALDVTIQAQILDLMNKLKDELDTSIIFITHDLGVVAQMADRVAVMYAGQIVEIGTADEIFYNPMHPYTWGLLASMPTLDVDQKNLYTIPGSPPNLLHPPVGDAFAARNDYALAIDFQQEPEVFKVTDTHYAKTWLLHPDAPDVTPPLKVVRRKEKYEALFSVKMYANSTGGGINGG
ncbi:oligopeptide transport system ATP-binding protein [Alkalibacterium putridalgicola]|uniref:ABC transporter ATP-binding protein n=1 Tax=Alkalibacterium putridalgicola TaxID=426703 RepID=A0A1H7QXR2_9LACT|nr:ABC transporter ATP-binding protein [Alkalibacterium putridalgicola]GEK88993.1 ABC transporter ATP-binding protein [Alkalibacterium putridalgicola]SEL52780.1 oligopeptide transport system ATP-binding protein [Alkalibacterium putridalgicola]